MLRTEGPSDDDMRLSKFEGGCANSHAVDEQALPSTHPCALRAAFRYRRADIADFFFVCLLFPGI
jgi:hypothetical protein